MKLVQEDYALFYDTPVRRRRYEGTAFHIQKFNVETLEWETNLRWHWVFSGIDPENAAEGNYSEDINIRFVSKQAVEAKVKAIKAAAAEGKKVSDKR